jgi:hypothetical protein
MIRFSDLEVLAEQFFILIVGIPQRLALLIGRDAIPRDAQRIKAAVRLFLYGCRRD